MSNGTAPPSAEEKAGNHTSLNAAFWSKFSGYMPPLRKKDGASPEEIEKREAQIEAAKAAFLQKAVGVSRLRDIPSDKAVIFEQKLRGYTQDAFNQKVESLLNGTGK